MASRMNSARIGAAILGASVALMATAVPASADTKAKLDQSGDEAGLHVNLKKEGVTYTGLIGLGIEGADTVAHTYCVELPEPVKGDAGMVEVPWDAHPRPESGFHQNRDKVNWILAHSYPSIEVDALRAAVKIDDLTVREAIAGTQAAIWHFSDNDELDLANPLRGGETDEDDKPVDQDPADVVALYQYLTSDANTGLGETKPSLDVAPLLQKGKAGDKIGPFTITTTAGEIAVEGEMPVGVLLTDAEGKPFTPAEDGRFTVADASAKTVDVYVTVPADAAAGSAKFSVHADSRVDAGRLFIRGDENKKTQSLIVASPVDVELDAAAAAEWEGAQVEVPPTTTTPVSTTPAPETSTTTSAPSSSDVPSSTTTPAPVAGGGSNDDDELASTGASIFLPLTIGVLLLAAGAAALVLVRRRKASA
ncbi:thioester domain-containing protein [Umezawaea beigongshangensis]|uniref:thioester domain-containing protein n=1 Tax=Umezawaea beigongshangensis TaxID=2780383 RepID=UPI0018F1156D|nr:thioester domain-containing protein [Umezawaea beigongshangensis]